MEIAVTVSGDRDVALRLEEMPGKLHGRLVATITALTQRLLGLEISKEPHKTGRLEAETKASISETPDAVRGQVSIDASGKEHGKAAAFEYGAHGQEVRAHARHGHTPLGAPAEQMLQAFSRPFEIAARRFARGSLDELRGEIDDELQAAIREALA